MTEDLLEHVDRLIARRPVSKDALVSYRELVRLMGEVAPQPRKIQVESRLKVVKKEEGFPLFSRNDLPLDFETSSALLSKFLDHLAATERADVDGLKKALEQSQGDSEWANRLFRAVLEKDEKNLTRMGKETDLEPKVLQFLAQLALRPSLQALRNAVSKETDGGSWDYGYCPLCGSQPNMAYFDKTGKRHLHCELCGEEWPHPRLNCPFCQTQEQKSLGYFHSEEEEGFRVDFCRKCNRYIKTVDKRIVEDTAPMEVEFLATIHLDLLANKHGFK
ncbi:MAG: formate dehydrogenase accessory protein FdhE [Desulfobacteraceae bacterium]|jgi:FdhE protein